MDINYVVSNDTPESGVGSKLHHKINKDNKKKIKKNKDTLKRSKIYFINNFCCVDLKTSIFYLGSRFKIDFESSRL